MNRKRLTIFVLFAFVVGAVGCDDPPPPSPPPPPKPAAPPPPPPVAPGGKAAAAEQRPDLADEEFIESVARNRDPFRSYLAEFSAPVRRRLTTTRKVLMSRFGIDELKLIAVITGRVRARAMFRDPTGLGVSVKRGDYIGKGGGMIKRIFSDKVIVQVEESSEDQQKLADRVIPLHSKDVREKALRP